MALFPSEQLSNYPLCADEMLELVEVMLDAEIKIGRTLDIFDKEEMLKKVTDTRKSYGHLRDSK